MIGKLLCALPKWLGGGHRRGEFVGEASGKRLFQCPRCRRGTSYKAKVAE